MRYLITAGPTREPIDDVRFISNRSSGRMGLSIAAAAGDAGHEVTLLMGRGATCTHELEHSAKRRGLDVHWFESTADLEHLLSHDWPTHDVLVMAAAVSDYRPIRRVKGKLARGEKGMTIQLEATPDLVAQAAGNRRKDQVVVAFAVEETHLLAERARDKLLRKGVNAIVANPLATMDAPDVDALWIVAGREAEPSGLVSKTVFAAWLVKHIDALSAK